MDSLRADLPGIWETARFSQTWQELGLTDDDLHQLQVTIMAKPTQFPVVSGTGGLRKVRFAPRSKPGGKRGGLRVCYVFYQRYGVIVLFLAYAKTARADIQPGEKKAIRRLVQEYEAWFEQRSKRGQPGEQEQS